MSTPAPTTIFDLAVTEGISSVIAQTAQPGLTGGELRDALQHARIERLDDGPNKRTALRTTQHNAQVLRGTPDSSSATRRAPFPDARSG